MGWEILGLGSGVRDRWILGAGHLFSKERHKFVRLAGSRNCDGGQEGTVWGRNCQAGLRGNWVLQRSLTGVLRWSHLYRWGTCIWSTLLALRMLICTFLCASCYDVKHLQLIVTTTVDSTAAFLRGSTWPHLGHNSIPVVLDVVGAAVQTIRSFSYSGHTSQVSPLVRGRPFWFAKHSRPSVQVCWLVSRRRDSRPVQRPKHIR